MTDSMEDVLEENADLKITLAFFKKRYIAQETYAKKLAGALAQMIGTHGEKCRDPDWNCDAKKYCLSVLDEWHVFNQEEQS